MNVSITPQQLPSGFCPTTLQEMWNTFAANGFVAIPDAISQIVWQQNKPSDSTVTWGQLDSLGRPIRIYKFAQGAWLSYHPMASGLTMWWFDVLPTFTTFDGGDANPLSDTTGPMWQQAKDSNGNLIAARFPIPAGTLPSTTVLALGDTGGEEKHVLTTAELATHNHLMLSNEAVNGDNPPTSNDTVARAADSAGGDHDYRMQKGTLAATIGKTSDVGSNTGHNTLPLYVVGYLLQRTTRIFYSVP